MIEALDPSPTIPFPSLSLPPIAASLLTQGVFLGVSVEAGTLVTRKDANRDFYGADVSAQELLLGDYPQPKAAEPLYTAIEEVR